MNHIFQKSAYSSFLLLEDQIRLVRLLPRVQSDDIEIELICADIALKPKYEALSYEWGPPSKSESPVFVDGQCLLIRENLWWALRHLRLESEPRILWIDALCINQNDVGERNHQVAQMGRIYEKSFRAIVWLGYDSTWDQEQDTMTAVMFLRGIHFNYSEFAYRPNQPWQSLANLCNRTYWTRLWIIQEVVLATDIWVQCGTYNFEWSILAGLCDQLDIFVDHPTFLQSKGLYEVAQVIHKSIFGRLNRQRIARQSIDSEPHALLDLLWTYKEALCEDARDKVFGLYSLAQDCCKTAIRVDYSESPFQILGILFEHHTFHHMIDTGLVSFQTCQSLHTLLQTQISFILSSRSLRPIEYNYGSANHKLIKAGATVEGIITWLSPFFDSLSPDDLPIPSASKRVAAYQEMLKDAPQVRTVMSFMGYPLTYWRQTPYRVPPDPYNFANHAGLTFDLPGSESFATVAVETQPPSPQRSRGARKFSDSLKNKLKNRTSTMWGEDDDGIDRWWRWLVSPSPLDERPRLRVLFTETSFIGFAPGNAKVGDVVCRIEKSDSFAILRPGGLQCEIVGRSSTIPQDTASIETLKRPKAQLYLDVPTLQILSWVRQHEER